jgi:hypothetical protein
MAIDLFTGLKHVIFSGLEAHSNSNPFPQNIVAQNILRVSAWGTLGSGAAALASSIFSKTLMQESSWKALAPHVFKASVTSCLTFLAVISCIVYKAVTQDLNAPDDSDAKALNDRVSLGAKISALVGFFGAAAAFASEFATSNTQVSSVAKYSLSPLLGLGTAGFILGFFHHRQNKELALMNEEKV